MPSRPFPRVYSRRVTSPSTPRARLPMASAVDRTAAKKLVWLPRTAGSPGFGRLSPDSSQPSQICGPPLSGKLTHRSRVTTEFCSILWSHTTFAALFGRSEDPKPRRISRASTRDGQMEIRGTDDAAGNGARTPLAVAENGISRHRRRVDPRVIARDARRSPRQPSRWRGGEGRRHVVRKILDSSPSPGSLRRGR